MVSAWRDQRDAPEVLEENWPAVQLYLAVQTQWRLAPDGQPYGLDYGAVDMVMRRCGFEDAAFEGLQVIERVMISL